MVFEEHQRAQKKTERLKPTMHEYLATCRSTDCARAGGGVVKRTGPGGGSRFEGSGAATAVVARARRLCDFFQIFRDRGGSFYSKQC